MKLQMLLSTSVGNSDDLSKADFSVMEFKCPWCSNDKLHELTFSVSVLRDFPYF